MKERAQALRLLSEFRRGFVECKRLGWDFGMDYYRTEFYAVYRALREVSG